MSNNVNPKDKIIEMIKNSSNPPREIDIANKLNLQRNLVHHHLKKLLEDKIVLRSEDKRYSINRLAAIWDLSNKILDLLKSKEYSPKELEEELGTNEEEIFYSIYLLENEGLIKEGEISLNKRGYIPRKGRTTLVINHFREATYTPTYLGYSKIGYCPVCRKEVGSEEKVIVVSFKHPDSDTTSINPWVSTKIHSKCMSKSKAYEETYHELESSMVCSYCGLPLTPKMLPDIKIDYKQLINHFSEYEFDSIRLLEGIKQSWLVPSGHPRIKEKYVIQPDNSTIKGVYKTAKIQIPKRVNDRIEKDKSLSQDAHENIYYEFWEGLIYIFEQDLSVLSNAENFLKLLSEYRSETPDGYDLTNRTKEIWGAACEIKSNYEKDIQMHYSKLLGPSASVYSCIDWAFDAEDYDFDKIIARGLNFEKTLPSVAQTFAIKHGEEYYHPYCADKFGLNHIHRDEKGPKEVTKND